MTIRIQCPNGHALAVQDRLAGKSGACPECGVMVQIPTASPPDRASEAAATPTQAAPAARPIARAVAKPNPPGPPPPPPTATAWHLRTPTGEQFGPADDDQFRQWIAEQRVRRDSYVWRDGWSEWRLASEAAAELPAPLAPPSPVSSLASATAPSSDGPSAADRYNLRRRQSQRNRSLAALLLLVLTIGLGGVLAYVLVANPRGQQDEAFDAPVAEPLGEADEAPEEDDVVPEAEDQDPFDENENP